MIQSWGIGNIGAEMAVTSDGEPATGPDDFERAFGENYPVAQYHFIQFVADHLADCSRVFGGDLQLMLVLAIIGQSHLGSLIKQGAQSLPKEGPASPNRSINASRISDVTGIPRQTVRRKLAALEARGWIEQTDLQGWQIVVSGQTSRAREDLAHLDARGIARATRFLSALRQTTLRSQ